ncbi:MAG TPA: 23S rRNA (guanosine(2251)-2'-O)-methyltransferase RlmB [Gammaproteobacteria bacterium]
MEQGEIVGGFHAVRAALGGGAEVLGLWLDRQRRDARVRDLRALAAQAGVTVELVAREVLDRMAPGVNHQGVVARCRGSVARDEGALRVLVEGLAGPALLLVLDEVTDPHNLGACLRTAAAAGADAVIAPRDRAAGLTATARKVAAGTAEWLPFFQVTNLARTLGWLAERGVWCVGLAGDAAQTLAEADLAGPLALVLGSEGRGLRRLTRERCDLLLRIPLDARVESLNVSVAAGVALFEARRQRGSNG